jgi:2-dehydropantoate 2-reductase
VHYAVIGAGAIGGYVGACLARAGRRVTLVAHGAHAEAMRERGVLVKSALGEFTAHPAVAREMSSLGPVDVVLLTLKAHQIAAALPGLSALLGPETAVVSMQNGIPWWYFQSHGGAYDGTVLQSVDPGGTIARTIEARRVLGCVVHSSVAIEAPGVIRHFEGTRYSLGEPNRTLSDRASAIAADFTAAGLKAPVEADLRYHLWVKLLGNAAFNPISALTRATLVEICEDPSAVAIVHAMMVECSAIAERLGIAFEITIERRIQAARRVGGHKTSMLQDLEARKPLELEALTGAIVELGRLLGIETPLTSRVYALAKLLDRSVAAARTTPSVPVAADRAAVTSLS